MDVGLLCACGVRFEDVDDVGDLVASGLPEEGGPRGPHGGRLGDVAAVEEAVKRRLSVHVELGQAGACSGDGLSESISHKILMRKFVEESKGQAGGIVPAT